MKLAVSNIAWAAHDRTAAYAVMQSHGVRGLEIAPGLFFHQSADPFVPTEDEVARAMEEAMEAGLQLVSMQALLFGVQGAALFGSPSERQTFRTGMLRAIALAGRLSIPNIVFGSPKQRIVPTDMSAAEAQDVALRTFSDLGDAALQAGTKLGMEFNPEVYGTNFLTTLDETNAFVGRLGHPAVTLIMDLGAMHLNTAFGEIEKAVASIDSTISHVHVSEPHLAPAPADAEQTARALSALTRRGYSEWVSIEMKQPSEPAAAVLDAALGRLVQAVKLSASKAGIA